MVQQLSLVAMLPHSKYIQTMSTLQALTGIETPQDISTYTLLTKPYPEFKPKIEPGKVNQIEQYFMKCITTWDDESSETLDVSKPIIRGEDEGSDGGIWVDTLFSNAPENSKRNWTLQISDIPIAGKNQTCSAQTVYESTLVHHHTPVAVPEPASTSNGELNGSAASNGSSSDATANGTSSGTSSSGNGTTAGASSTSAPAESDLMEIEDLTAPDTITSVPSTTSANPASADATSSPSSQSSSTDSFLQFLQDLGYEVKNQYWIKGVRYFHGDIFIETFKVFVRDDDFESKNSKIKLKLLDPTNTFQVKVYINVPRATDVELISQGTKELMKFQDFIKNLFVLEIPERMNMDSRVLKS